jgi:hypothetical protein
MASQISAPRIFFIAELTGKFFDSSMDELLVIIQLSATEVTFSTGLAFEG